MAFICYNLGIFKTEFRNMKERLKDMNNLYIGFKGKTNSSKILLDKIDINEDNKLYLTNSFITSVKELKSKLEKKKYNVIIGLGQLKLEKDVIRIEKFGCKEEVIETSYDYTKLKKVLKENGYIVEESNKTNYLCNNIYYEGLKYIKENDLNTKMIFIHVPKIKNINDIELLANIFSGI